MPLLFLGSSSKKRGRVINDTRSFLLQIADWGASARPQRPPLQSANNDSDVPSGALPGFALDVDTGAVAAVVNGLSKDSMLRTEAGGYSTLETDAVVAFGPAQVTYHLKGHDSKTTESSD